MTRLIVILALLVAIPLAATPHPCDVAFDHCLADCWAFGDPPVCGLYGCKSCSATCLDYAVYCRTGCWTGALGEIYCLDVNNP